MNIPTEQEMDKMSSYYREDGEYFDMDSVRALVAEGYLKCQTQGKLTVFNYTRKCEAERNWNPITRALRGAVLDSRGKVIGRAIPKFFHLNEMEETRLKNLPISSPKVYQKVDGSCMLLFYNSYEERWQFTSKCSFTSDYVKAAERILRPLTIPTYVDRRMTFVFELRFETDQMRRVVPFKEGLYFITAFDGDGEELDFKRVRDSIVIPDFRVGAVEELSGTVEEWISSIKTLEGTEGAVFHWPEEGRRVKFKTEWYRIRNKLLDAINTPERGRKFMLENMELLPPDLIYLGIPEDYIEECRGIVDGILAETATIEEKVYFAFERQKDKDAKSFALAIADQEPVIKSCLFMKRQGKDYQKIIRNHLLEKD